MARSLKELRSFNYGVMINASEKDIPDDAAAYSLNVDPESEGGILSAIDTDKLYAITSSIVLDVKTPVPWGYEGNPDTTELTNIDVMQIPNISIFEDKNIASLSFIGTKGRMERLNAINPRPQMQKVLRKNGLTDKLTWNPNVTITKHSDKITVLSSTNAVTLSSSIIGFAVTGFTDGVAVLTATGHDETQYDSKTLTMTTPDGYSVVYEFDNTSGGGAIASGALIGSNTCIQLNGAASVTEVIDEIEVAINSGNGHGNRMELSQEAGVLTLTYNTATMHEYWPVGSYFALDAAWDADTEIIKVTEHIGNDIYIKRGCFGTPKNTYTAQFYSVWGNRANTSTTSQIMSNYFYCEFAEWSGYSGNSIGGSGRHWIYCANAAAQAQNGYMDTTSTYTVTFNSTNKTVTFTGATPLFNEGDLVTFYTNPDSLNNGFSATIVKIDSGTWTLDTAPTTDTLDSDDDTKVYVESSLLKNCTLGHRVSRTAQNVGTNEEYKVQDWITFKSGENNIYATTSEAEVILHDTNSFWKDTYETMDINASLDRETAFYPFIDEITVLSMLADYDDSGGNISFALNATDTVIYVASGVNYSIAANNIIKIDNEYMLVTSVSDTEMTVQRGVLGSDAAAHDGSSTPIDIYKNAMHGIKQSVSKDLLKEGQEYTLSCYLRNVVANSEPSLSVTYNGSNFDELGVWQLANTDASKGYLTNPALRAYSTSASNIAQEHRWIHLKELGNYGGTDLDGTWRRYDYSFRIPTGMDKLSDLDIEFSNRGVDNSQYAICQLDLLEKTKVYVNTGEPIISTSILDNAGTKDLVLYDGLRKDFVVRKNAFSSPDEDIATYESPVKSPAVSSSANADQISVVKNNRELHIGLGGNKSNSYPQWLGYVNHKLFGQDNTDMLYQDEDTVHSYDKVGSSLIDKITVAGEFEYLAATWNDNGGTGGNLVITQASHQNQVGDNIVIREWADASNTWSGSGVWVVTARASGNFTCKRYNTLDPDPSNNNFLQTDGSNNNRDQNTGKVCYRPYYYYGIRDGDNHIYRITPSTRINNTAGGLDDDYYAGLIEKSTAFTHPINSITTCHSKGDEAGLGGGKIYYISSANGKLYKLDVYATFDGWTNTTLLPSEINLKYKAYKWSNDNINGNIGGDTEVYGGLAEESTPTIEPSGIMSDIVETKGPTADFVHNTESVIGNDTEHFDTRLWILNHPGGEDTFTEGNRFLFCGKTESANTVEGSSLFMADRTPATTWIKKSNRIRFIHAGIGTGSDGAGNFKIPVRHPQSTDNTEWMYYRGLDNGDSNKEELFEINPKADDGSWGSGAAGSGGDEGSAPNFNFGENIGWHSENSNPVEIIVAKYGLVPISDNDKDGILDGTGVVVPSTTTLASSGDLKFPYGNSHQRVSAHAVGVLGGSNTKWTRRAGRLCGFRTQYSDNGDSNNDCFRSMYQISTEGHDAMDWTVQPFHEAPSSVSLEKCMFVITDMHFGDYPDIKHIYNYTACSESSATGSGVTLIKFTLSQTAQEVSRFQAGDLIFVYDTSGEDFSAGIVNPQTSGNPYGRSCTVVSVDSSQSDGSCTITSSIDWAEFSSTNSTGGTITGAGKIYPHTSYFRDSSNDTGTNALCNWDQYRGAKVALGHFAYDESDKSDGLCFINGTDNIKPGMFTKHWRTAPEAIDGWAGAPGLIQNIDKLNFRAGHMIRPFESSEETFEDLLVGAQTAIDIPGAPDAVYHVKNGSKLHYHVNDTTVNNQFASRMFLSSKADSGQSNMYICDLNFMLPSESSFEDDTYTESQASYGWNSSEWNVKNWDIYMAGTIDAYTSTAAANANHHLANATLHPVITIGSISNFTYGVELVDDSRGTWFSDRGNASSAGGGINRMVGCCITILDKDTGTMQTRYIVGSRPHTTNNPTTSDSIHISVHYPFGHAPVADDYFYIWGHADVCTAPIRLLKETIMPHGLPNALKADPILADPMYAGSGTIASIDGDGTTVTVVTDKRHMLSTNDLIYISGTTNYNHGGHKITVTGSKNFTYTQVDTSNHASESVGTWTLINLETQSPANPIRIDSSSPSMKTFFGGLDMRKLRTLTTTGTDVTESSGITTYNVANLLSVGDVVTIDDSDAVTDYEGIFRVALQSSSNITVSNTLATGDADDTNEYNISTNQWESFLIERGNHIRIGELRSGFNQWDKGNVVGNISHYIDDIADTTKYLNFGEAFVDITPASTSSDGDFFEANTVYSYKLSLIYDGYQEGPLSEGTWTYQDLDTRSAVNVKIKTTEYSKRLTAVCVYRRDTSFDYYRLVKEIPTSTGWASSNGEYIKQFHDDGQLGASYEARTGMSEVLDTIKLKYGISAQIDGYLFAADCAHDKIKNASNLLFRSRPGMFSVFDYANDTLRLESKPTALANYNGRLYVFDENNTYRVNHLNLSIEDKFEGIGCLNKDAVVVTEYGMFFADKNGAYMHTGTSPIKISHPIHRGGSVDTSFGGTDNIKDVSWEKVVTESERQDVKVFFDTNISCILFKVEYLGAETDGTSKSIQYIWAYHLLHKRWDLWELSENSIIGKPFNGTNGELYIPINNAIFSFRGGKEKRDYTWVSKKLNMGEDSTLKVFNRLKLNSLVNDINLGGTNLESSDRLIVATNTGVISPSNITYSSKDSGHSQYKLTGSNKKGRWLQFKLENMIEDIDSIGIVYRRKTLK